MLSTGLGTVPDLGPRMNRVIAWSLLLSGPLLGGCSAWVAARPPSFSANAPEIAVEYATVGYEARLAELELKSVSDPAFRRSQVLRSAKVEGDAVFRLRNGRTTQWGVRCDATLDTAVIPPVRLVCLYAPDMGHLEPLALVLTSTLGGALSGTFFSMDGPYTIEGTRRLEIGLSRPDTVGFAVRKEGERELRAFIDLALPRMRAYAGPGLTPAGLEHLAPLLLVLSAIRDPRLALQTGTGGGYGRTSGSGVSVTFSLEPAPDDDAKGLPLPPPATPTSTAHEEYAARLAEAGQTDLARALWAMITRAPSR